MLELNYENLKQFKTNLLNRKIPFTIEKRNEMVVVSNGKKIAKAQTTNTISHTKKKKQKHIKFICKCKKSINKYLIKNCLEINRIEKIQ